VPPEPPEISTPNLEIVDGIVKVTPAVLVTTIWQKPLWPLNDWFGVTVRAPIAGHVFASAALLIGESVAPEMANAKASAATTLALTFLR
jgi:hypothetical protein